MFLNRWLDRLTGKGARRAVARRAVDGQPLDIRRRRRTRLAVELLEDRINPAPPLLTSIEGINFNEDAANNGGLFHIPPDPIGAAGPNHVVSVVNCSIQWHTKAGVLQNNRRLGRNSAGSTVGSFFQPLNPVNTLFDPKVLYDQVANRFVVVAIEQTDVAFGDPSDTSRILLAVSDDNDPNGTWLFHAINSKLNIGGVDRWADYPGFAVDADAVYVTANLYGFGLSGTFGGARLWIVHKTGFYSGGAATVTLHDPQNAAGVGQNSTLQPAHMYGTAPAGLGTFLISSGWVSGDIDFFSVIRVSNPVTAPAFSNQFINLGDIHNGIVNYPDAPQSGTTVRIDTGDIRALSAVWRNNQLYTVNTILPTSGPDAGTETAHWYRIDTTSLSSLVLADHGNIGAEDVAAGTRTYYPSIAVDGAGNIGIGFAASAPSIFPGAFYTARAVGDAAGTVQSTGTLAAGLAFYQRDFGDGRNRWGDYSGISIDPDNGTFWLFNEYALTQGTPGVGTGLGRWGTRWGSFTFAATAGGTQVLIDGGGNLVVTDTASGGKNDLLTLSRVGGNVRVHDPNNTLVAGSGTTQVNPNTVEAALAGITGNITVNTLAGSDALTVNFSGGNPLPAAGLVYHGGAGAGSDKLTVTGGSATTLNHTFVNASDGSVNVDGSLISYTGLEPVTDTMSAAHRVFTFTGGAETIVVADTGTVSDGLTRIDSSLGELVDFAVPSASLRILTNGGDSTTINSFDGTLNTPALIVEDGSATASTFSLGAGDIIPNATSLTVSGRAVFDLNGRSETIDGLSGNGTVENSAAGAAALTVGAANATSTFSGVMRNSGGALSLTKSGSGVLTLSGANTYSGATAIDAGIVRQGAANAVSPASSVTVATGASFELNGFAATIGSLAGAGSVVNNGGLTTGGNNASTTFSGVISGPGGLTKAGSGTFALAAANTFAGPTALLAGSLRLEAVNALPALTPSLTLAAAATLDLNNNDASTQSLSGAVGSSILLGTATLTVAQTGTATFSGVISGEGALTKSAAGTLILSGNNTYTGATTVNAGTLLVNGAQPGSAVSVAAGATLGGAGTVGPISSNGTVSPGSSPGILRGNGAAAFAAGSLFRVELDGLAAGTGYDQLLISDAVDLSGEPVLNVTRGFDPAVGSAFTILTGTAVTGTFSGLPSGAFLNISARTFQITYTETAVILTRVAAPAASLQISAPAGTVAGLAFGITVTALDAVGNIADSYLGTVTFTSSDGGTGVVLPANYAFTAGDAGVHAFPNGVTLVTAASQNVTATDTVIETITGSATIAVTPAVADHYSVTGPESVTAGTAFSVTVTVQDRFNNTVPGYRGTVRFSSSDPHAAVVLPADYAFTAADNGVRVFTNAVTLATAGAREVTATDTVTAAITGLATITVNPAAAANFLFDAPAEVQAGVAFSVTLTVRDRFGNVAPSYRGTVRFTSSDPLAVLPANYTFTADDSGIHTFTDAFTLFTLGTQTLRAIDTLDGSIFGEVAILVMEGG